MGETHRVSREVTDEEKQLWQAFKEHYDETEYDSLRVTELGRARVGMHPQWTRDIVRTWANEGLVISGANDSYDMAKPTARGRQVEKIESTLPSGESWR